MFVCCRSRVGADLPFSSDGGSCEAEVSTLVMRSIQSSFPFRLRFLKAVQQHGIGRGSFPVKKQGRIVFRMHYSIKIDTILSGKGSWTSGQAAYLYDGSPSPIGDDAVQADVGLIRRGGRGNPGVCGAQRG